MLYEHLSIENLLIFKDKNVNTEGNIFKGKI